MTTVLLIIIGVLLAALALCIFLVVNLRRMLILTNKAYAVTKEALEASDAEYNRVRGITEFLFAILDRVQGHVETENWEQLKKDFNKTTNKTTIEKTKLN